MYDTLRPELLTATEAQRKAMERDPVTVVQWDLFRANQLPYLEVRRPFMLGVLGGGASAGAPDYRPTLAHFFMRVAHDRGLLRRVYTQNIDGLDFKTGTPADKIIPVHGSLGRVECEGCGAPYDSAAFCAAVRANVRDIYGIDSAAPAQSTPVPCPACGRPLVKPATVLYGRSIPSAFWEAKPRDLQGLDLLIVAGTALQVGPANSVAFDAAPGTRRLLVNKEKVGDFGQRESDLFAQGECDASLMMLAKECGWLEDLQGYEAQMSEQSRASPFQRPCTNSEGTPENPHRETEPSNGREEMSEAQPLHQCHADAQRAVGVRFLPVSAKTLCGCA